MADLHKKPTILFVDDEARVGRLFGMMFQTEYNVKCALNARDALAILETSTVDVVITDQRMPEITGVQLLSQVRSRWPETARILLTGYGDLVAIIAAINEGEVHRFITKPWSQIELRDFVSEATELAEHLRETVSRVGPVWSGNHSGFQYSITSPVLLLDANDADRRLVRDILDDDYMLLEASSIEEAIEHFTGNQFGVVVGDLKIGSFSLSGFLEELAQIDPSIATVAMTSEPHGDAVIKLINNTKIFRFAMKPLSANLFRSKVGDAMREHHKRLADPRTLRRRMRNDASADQNRERLLNRLGLVRP